MPGKAAWLDLENDEQLEFEFFLAEKLKIGTVAEMRARMSHGEFVYWSRYYSRRAAEAELEAKKASA